jgi:breast cancer 2 susceptibility protein
VIVCFSEILCLNQRHTVGNVLDCPCAPSSDARAAIVGMGCDANEVTHACAVEALTSRVALYAGFTASHLAIVCQANPAWVWNHFRWIVWKLGCEERRFPDVFPLGCRLSWTTVVHQLLYRYEREFNVRRAVQLAFRVGVVFVPSEHASCCQQSLPDVGCPVQCRHRSALYHVLEGGMRRCGFMVLLVSELDVSASQVHLSDGWYSMVATLDPELLAKLSRGDIHVGSKLAISSCSVSGVEPGQAVDPLDLPLNRGFQDYSWTPLMGASSSQRGSSPCEDGTQPKLVLHYNAVRPAKWDARLGFQRLPKFPIRLSSAVQGGGPIPCADLLVVRRFCPRYGSAGTARPAFF